MKVLLISPLPPPMGGIATWSIKFIEYCKKNKIEVKVINTAVIGKRKQKYKTHRNPLIELYRLIVIIMQILTITKQNSLLIAHVNSSCSRFGLFKDYLIVRLLSWKKIPVVFQCHCNIEDQINQSEIHQKILVKISSLTKVILTLNEKSFAFLNKLQIKNIEIFPNFIDDEFLLTKPKVINEKVQKIVYVGHVSFNKGIRELLESAEKFKELEFLLIGKIYPEVSTCTIPNNVKLIGALAHEKIIEYLDDSDVFVFPSYTEGFSIALLEAMARGLPIITTDVGNSKELLIKTDEQGGLVIPRKDVNALYNSLVEIQKYALRVELSTYNYKYSKLYAKTTVLKKLVDIYTILIERG